jgi:predicted  nucleic acid-binding Zn-ribbon protein
MFDYIFFQAKLEAINSRLIETDKALKSLNNQDLDGQNAIAKVFNF